MRKDSASIGELDQHHDFLNDNEFIVRGYRLNFSSIGRIFRSLFMCHNESMNVWSHLLGAIVFLGLLWYVAVWIGFAPTPHTHEIYESLSNSTYVSELRDTFETLRHMEEKMEERVREVAAAFCPNVDTVIEDIEALLPAHTLEAFSDLKSSMKSRIVHFCEAIEEEFDSQYFDFLFEMYNPYKALMHPSLHANTHVARCKRYPGPMMVFVFTAFFCLGCSATFHLFNAYSMTINRFMSRLDYAGISLLIAGSSYPLNYYFFYCQESRCYVGLIWVYLTGITVCALVVFCVSLSEKFQQKEYRTGRGLCFLALGLMGVIPAIHAVMTQWELAQYFIKPTYFVMGMGALYIIGVFIYIARFPEKYFPGRFDLIGSSHNIWHFFVLAAAVSHYVGSLGFYHTRQWLVCPSNN